MKFHWKNLFGFWWAFPRVLLLLKLLALGVIKWNEVLILCKKPFSVIGSMINVSVYILVPYPGLTVLSSAITRYYVNWRWMILSPAINYFGPRVLVEALLNTAFHSSIYTLSYLLWTKLPVNDKISLNRDSFYDRTEA